MNALRKRWPIFDINTFLVNDIQTDSAAERYTLRSGTTRQLTILVTQSCISTHRKYFCVSFDCYFTSSRLVSNSLWAPPPTLMLHSNFNLQQARTILSIAQLQWQVPSRRLYWILIQKRVQIPHAQSPTQIVGDEVGDHVSLPQWCDFLNDLAFSTPLSCPSAPLLSLSHWES